MMNWNLLPYRQSPAGTPGGPPAFDADYQAVLNFLTLKGYALPTASTQTKQNQMVVSLKAEGIWALLDSFLVFATDGDSDAACVDWKALSNARLLTKLNSPGFTPNVGFAGDGIAAKLAWPYNPTAGPNYALTSASLFAYIPAVGAFTGHIGGFVDTSGLYDRRSVPRIQYDLNYPGTATFVGSPDAPMVANTFYHVDAPALDTIQLYTNGILTKSSSRTFTVVPNGTGMILTRGDNPGTAFTGDTVGIWGAGASLALKASQLSTIINTYITSL